MPELFDRPINANPALTRRLAHGTPDDPAENMTFGELLTLFNGGLLKKIVPLGGVDFSIATGGPWQGVAHGLDGAKIRSVKVFIQSDYLGTFHDILSITAETGAIVHGYAGWNATHVNFGLPEGSNWISIADGFNDTGINRGYAVIEYLP